MASASGRLLDLDPRPDGLDRGRDLAERERRVAEGAGHPVPCYEIA